MALKAPIDAPNFTGTVVGVTKAMVGLTNVDDTSDADKPVSTATQTALDLKATIASPILTGVPAAPTAAAATSTTQIATTQFVTAAVGVAASASQVYADAKGLLVIQSFTATGTINSSTQLATITPPNDVSLTITLPTSPPTGTQLRLKRTNDTSGTIQITGMIDGEESRTMNTAYQSFYLVYNGTQWLLIN